MERAIELAKECFDEGEVPVGAVIVKDEKIIGEGKNKVIFENVLIFDDGKTKKIGKPYVKSLSFSGTIDSHGKEKKVIVFKKKRRKGHQKKNGHQQKFTCVTIDKFSKSTKKSVEKPKTATKSKTAAKPKAATKSKTAAKPKKTTTKKGDK